MKLSLSYAEEINGKFTLGPLNLMMVFQVNCPGCFMHGFPLLKDLQAYYGEKLSCVALSTAFEDFDLNTAHNAKLMVNTGELVGETLKAQKAGMLKWETANLSFPVLVDEVVSQAELQRPEFVESITGNLFERPMSDLELNNTTTSLQNYFGQLPKCGKTFAANLMRGTPSFVLFTESMDVLVQWFGHADNGVVKQNLDVFVYKKGGVSHTA